MKLCQIGLLLFASTAMTAATARAAELTAMTLFGCDDQGNVDVAFRNNSGPIDAAWDLFLYEGDVFDKTSGDVSEIKWLNNTTDHSIKVPLGPGKHTFTFHCECSGSWPAAGANLFLDGIHDRPALSVRAPISTDRSFPKFIKNSAAKTMGWPITDVPASGSLTSAGIDTGIWDFPDTQHTTTITMTSFRFANPDVDGNLDLVGPHEIGASGKPDFVGQFELTVEPVVTKPSNLFLWLQTVAGMTVGGPNRAKQWKEHLDWEATPAPFSFGFGEVTSDELLKRSRRSVTQTKDDTGRARHTVRYDDPVTGLQVRWEGTEYAQFKTVEWTLFLANTGTKDSPILRNILGLDCTLSRRSHNSEFVLHHNRGDSCDAQSYEPLQTTLSAQASLQFAPNGGRPTTGAFPYFNLRSGTEGVALAVGWPGQWSASFTGVANHSVHITAGQQLTHMTLHAGETIRSPLIVLQFTDTGDWIDAQNVWRQWMIQHNLPRPGGRQLPLPMFNGCSSHQFAEMTKASEKSQIEFIDSYLAKGLKLDHWWMDAGWYVGAAEKGWPWTGTWEVDRRPHRFPNGLRAVSDYAHKKDVKIIVWFEPERVAGGTWLAEKHPDWILGGKGGGLLNLGDPHAWNWLVNHIDAIITTEGIDLYRQDFNIDPLDFWRNNDPKNRQGITENKYVMGYLAYWDELLRRHPGMLIDSCASGGRRNDLETMRRAVPFLRSDYLFEPVGQQGHTYGISFWLPYHGTGYAPSNGSGWGWGAGKVSYGPYIRRSNMCPSNIGCFDFRIDVDDKLIQKLYREWIDVGPNYFGDYYPLTDYNRQPDSWIAWQFHRRDENQGMIQAFRRDKSEFFGGQFRLRGLSAECEYEIRNVDETAAITMTGRQMMDDGVKISIAERPGAAVVTYRQLGKN